MSHRLRIPHAVLACLSLFLVSLVVPAFAASPADILGNHEVKTPAADWKPMGATVDPGTAPALAIAPTPRPVPATPSFTLAVMADMHICKENVDNCKLAVKAINGMRDVKGVAVLGDSVKDRATQTQFDLVVEVLAKLKAPKWVVAGNHDYLYADALKSNGDKQRGTKASKAAKLERLRKAFDGKALHFAKVRDGYLLVFLSVDALEGKSIVTYSKKALRFLRKTLEAHPKMPTIVLAHAPLMGSYKPAPDGGGLSPFQATVQPAEEFADILRDNPQVFLWVAGHRHATPNTKSYLSHKKVGRVSTVRTPNIKAKTAWFLTLELQPKAVVVRTYDAKNKRFLRKLDRHFRHGMKIAAPQPAADPDPADDGDDDDVADTTPDAEPAVDTSAEDDPDPANGDDDDTETGVADPTGETAIATGTDSGASTGSGTGTQVDTTAATPTATATVQPPTVTQPDPGNFIKAWAQWLRTFFDRLRNLFDRWLDALRGTATASPTTIIEEQ